MRFKLVVSGTLSVLLGSSVVWAGGSWKKQAQLQWSAEQLSQNVQQREGEPIRVRVSSIAQNRKLVHKVEPSYPDEAIALGLQGTVELDILIGEDGSVRQVQFVEGSPLLAEAAMAAVRQWRYDPTLLDGKPIEVSTSVGVRFRPYFKNPQMHGPPITRPHAWKRPQQEMDQADISAIRSSSPWARMLFVTTDEQHRDLFDSPRLSDATTRPVTYPSHRIGPSVHVPDSPQVSAQSGDLSVRSSVAIFRELGRVEWASSFTMRRVNIREAQLRGELSEEEADKFLGVTQSRYYIIRVRGEVVPIMLGAFGETLSIRGTLRSSATIQLAKSKQEVHPVAVNFYLGGKDRVVEFYFERNPEGGFISPKERKVEFKWVSPANEVTSTFDLRSMKLKGKPDL
jgi:TonB family protein